MARRSENECAFCAEEVEPQAVVIGKDWKVYCSTTCAQRGEDLSVHEITQLMRYVSDRHQPLSVAA